MAIMNAPHAKFVSFCCGLCREVIEPDDEIIVVTLGGRTSDPFVFPNSGVHLDDKLNIEFQPCRSFAQESVRHDVGCHKPCFEFLSDSGRDPVDVVQAMEPSYDPHPSEIAASAASTEEYFAQLLYREIGRLPAELWQIVAIYASRYFSITSLEKACGEPCQVSTNEDIWATYIVIDGLRYITKLSNTVGDELVATGGPSSQKDTFHVLEDYLGIRNVLISRNDVAPEAYHHGYRRAWWRSFPITQENFKFKSDGIKLRSLLSPTAENNLSWSSPLPQSELQSLEFSNLFADDARMVSLPVNEVDITGYSAIWNNGINYLHAHRVGEKPDFYSDIDTSQEQPLGIYMPLWKGEYVAEIWLKLGMPYYDMAIVLKTDTGRMIKAGSFTKPTAVADQLWVCLTQFSSPTPSRIFFNYSRHYLTNFVSYKGAESDSGPSPEERALTPYPNSWPSRENGGAYLPICHSSASLEGVVSITACRICDPDPRIVGLLFQYTNGNQVTVGSYRLDCAQDTISTKDSPGLTLGLENHEYFWHVRRVETSWPEDRGTLKWKEIPWAGTLEWWFRFDTCAIYHTLETY